MGQYQVPISFEVIYMQFNGDLPEIKINGLEIIFVSSLHEVIQQLSGQTILPFFVEKPLNDEEIFFEKDFNKIIGHSLAKRALEIAAAGGHHVFMAGPPGCGKSMLAETFHLFFLRDQTKLSLKKLAYIN
jgi:magnesium chelatase family protein